MQSFGFQRRLLLSPQVFQQACRRSSSTSQLFQRALPKSRPQPVAEKLESKTGPTKSPLTKDVDEEVRWFEKDVDSGDIKKVSTNPEDEEATEVRKKLGEMTARMRRYDAGIDSKEYHETVVAAFPEEQRRDVAKALTEERARRRQRERNLKIELPSNQLAEPVLKHFHRQLELAADDPESEVLRKELWKCYQKAKRMVPGVNARIPAEAWHVLWKLTSQTDATNVYREDRLLELAQGMTEARVQLLPREIQAKYEAMVIKGQGDEAVLQWKREYEASNRQDKNNLETGIKLYAAVGDIRGGFRVVRQYLQQVPQADARVMHTLIQASIQTGNDHMAYTLYLTMRDRLGRGMKMHDYDIIIARFLTENKKDLALAVFRDMMMQGTDSIEKKRITIQEEQKLRESTMRRIDIFQNQSISGQEINEVSLQALASLPTQWQNKFFFGSWIKKLIGMSDLSGAMKVVELMYQRGVTPDATHVNGIIGGLMRSNDRELERRGQSMAWAMIYRRIAHNVSKTGHDLHILQDFGHIPSEDKSLAQQIPLDLSRPVPHANVETFNVLGLHYLLSSQWTHLRHLRRMIKPAGTRMSSFFMNHLLYMQLYNNGPEEAWNDFLHYTKDTRPDTETYNALWHAQQDVTDPNKRVQGGTLPRPRVLFKVMMDWRATLNARVAETASEAFGAEIYARIVTAFCNEKDFPALVVAMYATLQGFGTAPDADVAGLIVTGLGNVYEGDTPVVRGRRGRRQLRGSAGKADAVEKVLQVLRTQRVEKLGREGVLVEEMDEAAQAAENVNLLAELVKTVLVRIKGEPAVVDEAIRTAAQEMGVSGMRFGDVYE
ncbi:Hypothetical protein D9617_2g058420 [Elsinoe fawcettii]|nr:Hypothetical protein D9617_2g058420 [Elsinoe fawcettii]